MTFYLIRHRATGEIMPQMLRGRGYSHWNPGNPNAEAINRAAIPRLLTSEAQAKRVIQAWAIYPNASMLRYEQTMWGDAGEDFRTKPDGRKREDLTIVKTNLVEMKE